MHRQAAYRLSLYKRSYLRSSASICGSIRIVPSAENLYFTAEMRRKQNPPKRLHRPFHYAILSSKGE